MRTTASTPKGIAEQVSADPPPPTQKDIAVHGPSPHEVSRRIFVGGLAGGLALHVQSAVADHDPARSQMEISIRSNVAVTTLVNVFTVEPKDQEKLIQLLREGTEALFSKQPGYISASFHSSQDGRRVVNYGQWQSPQDIEAFRTKPEIGEYFNRVKALAQFEAIVCEASYVHHV